MKIKEILNFISFFFPFVHRSAIGNSVQLVSGLPSPRFLKSHLPYQLLPEQMDQVKPKVYISF